MSMSASGVLSGTPASEGTYTVAVTATDIVAGSGAPGTRDYTLNVAYAPLAFTTTTLSVVQGQSYIGQVVAQGGEAPYTESLLSGTLPSGLSFNNGTITGTTTAASGDYPITVGVTDSQTSPQTARGTFNLWVAPSETAPDLNVTSSTTSTIWDGYVEQSSTAFTSVSGTFTVPTVQASLSNEVSPWVGIDGYGTNNLIQAGVTASGGGGTVTYEAWWETLGSSSSAQNLPPQNQFAAKPGDSINVAIWQVSTGQWEITLNDTTSGQGFATQVSYTGTDDTAEWIVEEDDTQAATGYGATTSFSNLQASQTGTGMLDLSALNGTPGTLSGSGFTLTQY